MQNAIPIGKALSDPNESQKTGRLHGEFRPYKRAAVGKTPTSQSGYWLWLRERGDAIVGA
jgi:hypothetical protein